MVLSGCYQTAPTGNPTLTAFRQPFLCPINTVVVNGSAIVGKIMHSINTGFQQFTPGYTVQIGESGTKEGFSIFCQDRSDIQMAVRAMSPEESSDCVRHGIHFIQVTIAYDALALVGNAPVEECISISELKFVYTNTGLTWHSIRAHLPAQSIKVFAPPQQAAVEFFNDLVMQSTKSIQVGVIQELIADGNGIGYLPFTTAQKLNGRIPIIALDSSSGCTLPTNESIWDGSYYLSRPLYLYINRQSLQRSEVFRFVSYTLSMPGQMRISEVDFLPASPETYQDAQKELDRVRENWQ